MLAGAWLAGLPPALSVLLALVPGLMLVLVRFFEKRTRSSGNQIEFLMESSFLLTGVMAALV
jgi:4-hydroxy-3-methylbut-2-enyl diphosphate reductase